MRIVGGTFGGRRFNPPARIPARPTTELAKEALFNMLANMLDFEELKALDLFGGTGSISYELASRGTEDVTVVERDPASIDFIKKTVRELAIESNINIIRGDVFKFMKQSTDRYNFIFADPPYALANIDEIPVLVFEKNLLLPGGIFIMEHEVRNDYSKHPNFLRMKNYGTTVFSFFTQPNE